MRRAALNASAWPKKKASPHTKSRRYRLEIVRSFVAGGLYTLAAFFCTAAALEGVDRIAAYALPALSRSIFVDHIPQYAPRQLADLNMRRTHIAALP